MNQILELYNLINHFGNAQEMSYTVIEPGHVSYQMPIKEQHASGPGVAHGGIIAAFMDAVLGVAALSLSVEEAKLVATVELKINYFKPVKIGQIIRGVGKIDHAGKSIYHATGEIYDENGQLLAKGIGTFNAYPAEKIKDKVAGLFEF